MNREACYIKLGEIDLQAMLEEWRWLIGGECFVLVRATALGDLFLKSDEGAVYFLDTMEGRFSCVASSEEDLARAMDVRANRQRWLMPHLVELARMEKPAIGPGQCYGWKVPPFLGGEPDVENLEPTDLIVHHSILGQLFRQTREPGN